MYFITKHIQKICIHTHTYILHNLNKYILIDKLYGIKLVLYFVWHPIR